VPSCIAFIEAGVIETGGWCSTCLLPSAVEFNVLMIGESGVSTLGRGRLCVHCNSEDFDDPRD
jgi:hypothetical protein